MNQLESVLSENCPNMLKGIRGTRCIDNTLELLYQLYKKNELENALPILEKYVKTEDYKNFKQIHPHLLRAVVLNLDNYIQKYSKQFLNYLFMIMEEHAITGIYFLRHNGNFADNKLMAKFQTYDVFPINFNELSNTVIIMMLQNTKTSIRRNTPMSKTKIGNPMKLTQKKKKKTMTRRLSYKTKK